MRYSAIHAHLPALKAILRNVNYYLYLNFIFDLGFYDGEEPEPLKTTSERHRWRIFLTVFVNHDADRENSGLLICFITIGK